MRPLVLVPVLIVALTCGTIVGYFVLPLGLVLHELILWPLAFGVGALFAALGAGWVGTLLASDQTRSRLLAVVGVSEATAAVVTVIGFLLLQIPAFAFSVLGIVFVQYGLGMVVIALAASWATWRFRSSRTHMGWDAMLTLILAIAVLVVSYELLSTALVGGSLLGLLFYLPIDLLSYIDPLSFALWVSIAGVALSVVLAIWRFRRRRDWLGMDAAITLGLAGLAPLIIMGTLYVAELFGLVGA